MPSTIPTVRPARPGARLAAAAVLAAAAAAHAAPPQLTLPLRCDPGRDCWVVNYADTDPGPGARDYRCGGMTYDGHDGTDFGVRDLEAVADGVVVVAAAAGVVRAVRDGEPDAGLHGGAAVAGRECGNGVRIEHADGWSTQYCHLRLGSVAVKPGDRLAAGSPVGKVGLSGKTEFPHLHLAVRQGRRAVDPFGGAEPPAGCGTVAAPLWNAAVLQALAYARGIVHNYGAAPGAPDPVAARRGAYRGTVIPASAPMIAIWAEAFGAMPGDTLRLELVAPGGETLVAHSAEVSRQQVRIFRWAGRKRPAAGWPPGKYHGKIRYLSQDDPPRALSSVEFDVEVR